MRMCREVILCVIGIQFEQETCKFTGLQTFTQVLHPYLDLIYDEPLDFEPVEWIQIRVPGKSCEWIMHAGGL